MNHDTPLQTYRRHDQDAPILMCQRCLCDPPMQTYQHRSREPLVRIYYRRNRELNFLHQQEDRAVYPEHDCRGNYANNFGDFQLRLDMPQFNGYMHIGAFIDCPVVQWLRLCEG